MSLHYALSSYLRIRTFHWRIRDRASLARWQDRQLARWLARDVPKVAAFAQGARALADLPIMDKATLMADFTRYNTAGITNDAGWAAFAGPKQIGDLIVGASTGTSGNRGLFVISQAERFAWLGAILAKAAPDFWRHRDRIAVILPLDTPLYDSANKTRLLTLGFFNVGDPFDDVRARLERFAPTVLIAPPRMLRRLAKAQVPFQPRRIFSAAETLDPLDRGVITQHFTGRFGEIYMATEGLFATTCAQGRLHLAEDCMHFAFEPAGDGLVMPVISDFSRRVQIMARYRMNDLLRLDPTPCACGSALQGVAAIVGREDDIFFLARPDGSQIEITPDILRNCIVDTDRAIDDFRLIQTGPSALRLEIHHADDAVRARLNELLQTRGVLPTITLAALGAPPPGKLRRIRRDWTPQH